MPAGLFTCVCVAILIFGLWGKRIGNERRCRRCLHIVDGLPKPVCPECGADLENPRAVCRGTRRRHWWIAGASAFLMLVSGTVFVKKTFVAPGWEDNVPGWWLSKVEMRFATGQRFEEALYGVFGGRDTGRISQSCFEESSRHGFNRFYSQLQLMAKPSMGLQALALEFAEMPEAEPLKVCWAIRQYVEIEKQFPKSIAVMMTPPGDAQMRFHPGKWELHCSYDITNAEGRSIGNSGTELCVGRFSTVTPHATWDHYGLPDYDNGPPPFTCTWKFRLINPDIPTHQPYEWSETYEFKPLAGYGPVGATR